MTTRRDFIVKLASVTGAVVLLPSVSSCKKDEAKPAAEPVTEQAAPTTPVVPAEPPKAQTPEEPPKARPDDWDAMAYNKKRGAEGAIPAAYMTDINGPDGDSKHLGKHLPFQPKVDAKLVPGGFIALMWGDPDKGHAKHPNAVKAPENNNEGHWYNWIRITKAEEGDQEELESNYSSWPQIGEGDDGKFVAVDGGDITADGGKNTIYLTGVPEGLKAGDTVRVWAHCLTHGEYVDFLTLS